MELRQAWKKRVEPMPPENLKLPDRVHNHTNMNHQLLNTLAVAVVLLIATATANATITDFNISNPYVWDDQFSMWGHIDNANADRNILCDFYVFAHDGHLIKRFTSEYAGTGGQFSSNPQALSSPPFYRGQDYNAVVYCAGQTANHDFNVIQRASIETNVNQEFRYLLNTDNIFTILIVGIMIVLAFFVYSFARRK